VLAKYVVSFQFAPRQLVEIVAIAARRLNRQEVWIPSIALSTETHVGKTVERAVLVFRADSVHRILVVSTDPDLKPIVAGSPKDSPNKLPTILPDDPALLFRQIARLFSLPQAPSPPPLSAASLPPPIPSASSNRPGPAGAPAVSARSINMDLRPLPAAEELQKIRGCVDAYAASPQRSYFMEWTLLFQHGPGGSQT
jgi:hypothetical protein